MKGVILCGGKGTRLLPATKIINKHLLPLLNMPMVLYPLKTLKSLGVKDILLISGGNNIGDFAEFLGDGSEYGINLTYKVQKEAGGIAQAIGLAEDFVGGERFMVVLGDNIFGDLTGLDYPISSSAIFVKKVIDPERFGVYSSQDRSIEEKPKNPKSGYAVTGLYIYDSEVFDIVRNLKPSGRGELEVTDINNYYLKTGKMSVFDIEDIFWSDAGTPESLYRSITYLKNQLHA